MKWMDTAGDIASASTALCGLLLVFIGFITTSFGTYEADAQSTLRKSFLRKGWLSFVGFLCGLLAAGSALTGKVTESIWLIQCAFWLLALAFTIAAVAAVISVWEMR